VSFLRTWRTRWSRPSAPVTPIERLVVGLGNPGRQYAATRHNVGFWVCELLVRDQRGAWRPARYHAAEWTGALEGRAVALVKPQTFVNDSGRAVRAALAKFGLGASDLIVIHDDIDLGFGKLRIRDQGSSGGHNGIKSIAAALQTDRFLRVKIGFGRPPDGMSAADFVLQAPAAIERPAIDGAVARAAEAVRRLLTVDVVRVMQEFND